VVELAPPIARLAMTDREILQFLEAESEKIPTLYYRSHFVPISCHVNTAVEEHQYIRARGRIGGLLRTRHPQEPGERSERTPWQGFRRTGEIP